jgi:hypothetical protein
VDITKQLENKPDDKDYRFIVVLNKKIEVGKLFNALGHMTAGLAAELVDTDQMDFVDYVDADGGYHKAISHFGFIVLKAKNSNQIRTLRNHYIENDFPFTDFTDTMTVGTSKEQLEKTISTKEEELEYFGIATFGKTEDLAPFTKKYSIFSI